MIDKVLQHKAFRPANESYFFQLVPIELSIKNPVVRKKLSTSNSQFRLKLVKGVQQCDQMKKSMAVKTTNGRAFFQKVQLNFSVLPFNPNKNIQFILILLMSQSDEPEKQVGRHSILSSNYINQYKNEGTKYHNQIINITNDYTLSVDLFIQNSRFELEKLIKLSKDNKKEQNIKNMLNSSDKVLNIPAPQVNQAISENRSIDKGYQIVNDRGFMSPTRKLIRRSSQSSRKLLRKPLTSDRNSQTPEDVNKLDKNQQSNQSKQLKKVIVSQPEAQVKRINRKIKIQQQKIQKAMQQKLNAQEKKKIQEQKKRQEQQAKKLQQKKLQVQRKKQQQEQRRAEQRRQAAQNRRLEAQKKREEQQAKKLQQKKLQAQKIKQQQQQRKAEQRRLLVQNKRRQALRKKEQQQQKRALQKKAELQRKKQEEQRLRNEQARKAAQVKRQQNKKKRQLQKAARLAQINQQKNKKQLESQRELEQKQREQQQTNKKSVSQSRKAKNLINKPTLEKAGNQNNNKLSWKQQSPQNQSNPSLLKKDSYIVNVIFDKKNISQEQFQIAPLVSSQKWKKPVVIRQTDSAIFNSKGVKVEEKAEKEKQEPKQKPKPKQEETKINIKLVGIVIALIVIGLLFFSLGSTKPKSKRKSK